MGDRSGASRWVDEADPRADELCYGDGQLEVHDAARPYNGYTGLVGFVLKSLGNHIVNQSHHANMYKRVLELLLESNGSSELVKQVD